MRILSHGIPFFSDPLLLELYKGPHEIRTLGIHEGSCYIYDPVAETAQQVISRISETWAPDLMLCWMPEVHPPPQEIERVSIMTVALVSDWNVFYSLLNVNLSRYDVVLCDKPGARALQSEYVTPHHVFPLYSQLTPYHRPYEASKDIDVVFVGNLDHAVHNRRAHYIERLAKLSDLYRVAITTGVYGEDYGRLLARSRIVFNHSIRGELNLRVFETMACGSLAFLEEDNEEVRDWFRPDEEVVLYNQSNFEERIHYFLEHPDKAETIAKQGRCRVADYAGELRLNALIEWIAEATKSGRRFHALPDFEKDYQTFLMYAFSRWTAYLSLETRYLAKLMTANSSDPHVLTAVGQHCVNEYQRLCDSGHSNESEKMRERAIKSFLAASEKDLNAAPYALNAAMCLRQFGLESLEEKFLRRALTANSLAGADIRIGAPGNAFRARWNRAETEKRATLEMLRAEASIRLAECHCRRGEFFQAEESLINAEKLDSDNTGGALLFAEVLWIQYHRTEAISLLRRIRIDMPMNMAARTRLHQMLSEMGHADEARSLEEEGTRIARALILHKSVL